MHRRRPAPHTRLSTSTRVMGGERCSAHAERTRLPDLAHRVHVAAGAASPSVRAAFVRPRVRAPEDAILAVAHEKTGGPARAGIAHGLRSEWPDRKGCGGRSRGDP